jgi:hypothetical protein
MHAFRIMRRKVVEICTAGNRKHFTTTSEETVINITSISLTAAYCRATLLGVIQQVETHASENFMSRSRFAAREAK